MTRHISPLQGFGVSFRNKPAQPVETQQPQRGRLGYGSDNPEVVYPYVRCAEQTHYSSVLRQNDLLSPKKNSEHVQEVCSPFGAATVGERFSAEKPDRFLIPTYPDVHRDRRRDGSERGFSNTLSYAWSAGDKASATADRPATEAGL